MADASVPSFRPMFKKGWVGWDGVMAMASKRLTAGTMKRKENDLNGIHRPSICAKCSSSRGVCLTAPFYTSHFGVG